MNTFRYALRRLALCLLVSTGIAAAHAQTTYTVQYRYDAQGRLTQASYDEVFTLRYVYDAAGNIVRAEVHEGGPVAVEAEASLPARFALHANYPNPFNPSTTLRYDLPRAARVELAVYDVLGRRVALLVDGEVPAGRHTAVWDGRSQSGAAVASGLYLYRLTAGSFTETRTMLLVK